MNSATVSSGDAALASHYNNLRKDLIINGGEYAVTTGSADAYVLAIDAQFVAYTAGDTFKFKTNFGNTGSCTLNVNSVGAKTLKDLEGNTFGSGAIPSGAALICVYNGTDLIVIGGALATTSNKGVVEMATDAEVTTGTNETRYVNPKQVAVVKNGTYTGITVSVGAGSGGATGSESGIIATSTVAVVSIYSLNGTGYLEQYVTGAWSTLYENSTYNTTLSFTFMLKQGINYRCRAGSTPGGSAAVSVSLYYTV